MCGVLEGYGIVHVSCNVCCQLLSATVWVEAGECDQAALGGVKVLIGCKDA